MHLSPIFLVVTLPLLFLSPALAANPATQPIQIDLTSLLNARVVTTFADNKITPFTINLDGGIATQAAADALKITTNHTVPNDGLFPATEDHPEIQLHFSNTDATSFQVRRMPKEDEFSFEVPPKKYAQIFLTFTSGNSGPAPLAITLIYNDNTAEPRHIICPDWWHNLDDQNNKDNNIVYLAKNLAKFSSKNTIMEKDHHNIYAIKINPASDKLLTKIKIQKTRPLVCFWSATAIEK